MTSSSTTFSAPAGSVAKVSIIDTGTRCSAMPVSIFLSPPWDGFDHLNDIPSLSFLIESPAGKKLLFDLGFPADLGSLPPAPSQMWGSLGIDMKVGKDVSQVLVEQGILLRDVGAVVWSHHHSDHIGDIRTFPKTTDVVVGPGFTKAFLPGYPNNPNAELHESYFNGRNLLEIDFSEPDRSLEIGPFRAFDFFGDGSFYLLDTPGHDHGHLAGLARTTSSPDTFIFMAGDLCHHSGELRPSPYLPLPETRADKPAAAASGLTPCIFSLRLLQDKQVARGRKAGEPFFNPGLFVDFEQAVRTIEHTQLPDAADNVFVVMAHDAKLLQGKGKVEFFPAQANDWREKGWKRDNTWKFLGDLM
ncbi:beta-lactamase-like protein [Microdochium bolleyi]|uniref:Beta-lactamase-like protein n=1 Tax=Microdochium bolleyi TaxID=196109 RepID=A0A136IJA3_9PEZI|nr:beta-lactamase-like protein [Microdochium bolleyi]